MSFRKEDIASIKLQDDRLGAAATHGNTLGAEIPLVTTVGEIQLKLANAGHCSLSVASVSCASSTNYTFI